MTTVKQRVIDELKQNRNEEYQGSRLELYTEVQNVLDEIGTSNFEKITDDHKQRILNRWVRQKHCPVDFSMADFR
jgi:L-rhamnose mutarotase